MGKSKVYFTDRKSQTYYNMLDKLEHIFVELGLDKVIQPGQKVMVKTHFGAWGNTNYLRPAYVRKIVDLIKAAGGHPFVAESCGLGYGPGGTYGGRTTATEYLSMAALNGFNEGTVGAPLIMADGYWGTDVFKVKVEGEYIKEVDVATATLDSDVVIVLSHAKGHGLGGLGGAIKNIGIGLVGKQGKAAMHLGEISIDAEKCIGPECSKCLKVCPTRCITMTEKAVIDFDNCISCGHCRSVCSRDAKAGAITAVWNPPVTQAPRFVENAVGVVDSIGADKFFYINLALDISDKCDCWNTGAELLVHDIGIFGSTDPLAIDQACFDAINDAPANPDSSVADVKQGDCKLKVAHGHKDPESGELLCFANVQFTHAEKMGLGSREYEIVTLTKDPPERKGPH
ncbi:MAG: DUF362 domain-containing protein [Candidatus Thorarchaeota archaeon]